MSLIKRESTQPRALESFWGDNLFNDFFAPASRFFPGLDLSVPRVNIVEEEKAYRVTADLPGVTKDNVDVSMEGHILTIKAHTESEKNEEKEGQVIRHERHEGKYLRRVSLGKNVSSKNVDATLKDGVLTVCIPKLEASAPSSIKISVQ